MLARRALTDRYRAWNRQWGAPFGHHGVPTIGFDTPVSRASALSAGCFGAQKNSTTRTVEFPWAFHAHEVRPGLDVVEIGGALSGFQFALATAGASVTNVDPFVPFGAEQPPDPESAHRQMNTWFDTGVLLRRSTLREAHLPSGSVDTVYAISTLEHLPEEELNDTFAETRRILRPDGRMVVTIDLFLDLHPFTRQTTNQWGANVALAPVLREHRLRLLWGDPRELFGFPGFDTRAVLRNLHEYAVNEFYPQLSQLLVVAPEGRP